MIKVFCIDDNPDDLVVLEALLKSTFEHIDIITSLSGQEGLTLCKTFQPDVILLDLKMPGMDGVKVCRMLKSDHETMFIPVIVITATETSSKTRIRALESGVDAFLTKPIDEPELLAQVRAMLRIKEAEDLKRREKEKLSLMVTERTKDLEEELDKNRETEKELREMMKRLEESRIASLDLMEDLESEIEMRKRTEEVLSESEEKFRGIFDTINNGLIYLSRAGKILDVNPTFEEMTGFSKKNLVNKPVIPLARKVLSGSDSEAIMKALLSVFSGEAVKSFQFNLNGKFIQVSSSFSPTGENITAVLTDLTQRKRIEKDNLSLLLRQQAILGAVPDIIMEVDNHGVYSWANSAGFNFFGKDVIGKEAEFYFEGEQNTLHTVKPLFDGYPDLIYVESWQRRQDGEIRLLAWSCRNLLDADGNISGALSSARDITPIKENEIELERAHEELGRLIKHLQKVREEERKVIARELHDEVGQLLTAIKIDLNRLKRSQKEDISIAENIENLNKLAELSIDTVRRITYQLRPQILDDLGLVTAIEWYINDFTKRTEIRTRLDVGVSAELPEEIEIVIFRILQEALNNIVKHSAASDVIITLTKVEDSLHMQISDNGIGIDPQQTRSSFSFGILNMRERTKEIGGKFEIKAGKNGGTVITLVIPVVLND